MKRFYALASAALLLLAWAAPGQALVVSCVNCSDTWTQQMERVTNLEELKNMIGTYQEAIQQTQQQIALLQNNIQQYQNMVQNTLSLPQNLLNQVKGQLTDLAKLTNQLNFQKGDYLAMGQVFDEIYPGLDIIKSLGHGQGDVAAVWGKWSEELDKATQATFQLSGSQLKGIADNSEALDQRISELLNTPDGQMKALQSSNALSAIEINELRQLRALMAASIQNTSQLHAQNNKREELSKEQRDKLMSRDKIAAEYQGYTD